MKYIFPKLLLLCSVALFVAACGSDKMPERKVAVESVTVSPDKATLDVGQTVTLMATISPNNADNQSVTWNSSDFTIASVDKGVVTAHKPGNAEITVTTEDEGKIAKSLITVRAPMPVEVKVEKVALDITEKTLVVGESVKLKATVSPENATNKKVIWSSSDNTVASVDANGVVKALKAGSTNITVTTEDGGKTAKAVITVKSAEVKVGKVELDITAKTLTVGESVTLKATVSPENATNKKVIWSSSDNTVASVDANGVVKALKAGSANITVTTEDGGKTAKATITVKSAEVKVEKVELDITAKTLTVGQSVTLKATVSPDNATNKEVAWSSADSQIATVDEYGRVKGINVGTVEITVTTKDGGLTAKATITVVKRNVDDVPGSEL